MTTANPLYPPSHSRASTDVSVLLDEIKSQYTSSRWMTNRLAKWCADHPNMPSETCRYCDKYWRQWANSKLDGHSKCVVTPVFKAWLTETMKGDARLTFAMVAKKLGVTIAVVRSWTFPIRETTHG